MDIISIYQQVGSYRGTAAICGTTPKTVRRVVARAEAGGLDLDPPGGTGDLERVDHAVVGQVEDRARSISLRARRLEHGSWSSGLWMCRNTHPSRSTSPLRHTRHRTRFTTNREEAL